LRRFHLAIDRDTRHTRCRFFDYCVGDALAIMRFALVVTKGFNRRTSAYR
jgi:hypothetical protein